MEVCEENDRTQNRSLRDTGIHLYGVGLLAINDNLLGPIPKEDLNPAPHFAPDTVLVQFPEKLTIANFIESIRKVKEYYVCLISRTRIPCKVFNHHEKLGFT